jgi:hypothetical protein
MIEVLCIRHEKPAELLLMKNEKVIETFSPYASQIAFADGVREARVRYGVRRTLMPLVVATRAKFGPNFRSLSRTNIWCLPVRSRVSQRLGYPLIGRSARHIYMHDFPRFQFDEEEGKKRTEEEIRDLQKITGPYLCRMIAQEDFPALSRGAFWANLLHILLDGPFTHLNIQLEELTSNALRSPESVVRCHLPNQPDGLVREPRLSPTAFRFVLPKHTEELTMPAQQRLWLDDNERLFPGPNHSSEKH